MALALLLGLSVVLLAVLDARADALRGPISRLVSTRLGRAVRIEDHLELHLLSFHPSAVINGIVIANPAWLRAGDMARIGKLSVQAELLPLLHGALVLAVLEVENAQVDLVRDRSDRANWRLELGGQSKSNKPTRLPVVRRFSLKGARLNYADELAKLKLTSVLSADEAAAGGQPWAHLNGTGQANDQPFTLRVIGQPLLGIQTGRPYKLTFAVTAAATRIDGGVTIAKAFDLGSLQADFTAAGQDLADLYHLTRLALPNTAPYRLAARIERAGTLIKVEDLKGQLGSSDLHGSGSVDTKNSRPLMSAQIDSRSLNLADLAPAFGTRLPGAKTPKAASNPRRVEAANKDLKARNEPTAPVLLFPDAKLDVQRIRGMDANVHFRARSIQANKVAIKEAAFDLKLDRGVLQLNPVSFTLTQGRIAGAVKLDASRDVPDVNMDVRLTGVRLAQFHSKTGQPPLEGAMVARAVLEGHGTSVHDVVSTANGTVTAVVPRGEVREAFAELTGIDAARGLGLLLTRNEQKVDVRCGVAQFEAVQGTLIAKSLVFDMQNMLVTGKGEIDLGTERLDLDLNGQPKKWHLVRVKSPIAVRGTLLKPSVGLNTGKALAQGGAAAGLGVLLSPVAAVLAFIDPGLAKDADCSALLNEAKDQGAPLKTADAGTLAPQ